MICFQQMANSKSKLDFCLDATCLMCKNVASRQKSSLDFALACQKKVTSASAAAISTSDISESSIEDSLLTSTSWKWCFFNFVRKIEKRKKLRCISLYFPCHGKKKRTKPLMATFTNRLWDCEQIWKLKSFDFWLGVVEPSRFNISNLNWYSFKNENVEH